MFILTLFSYSEKDAILIYNIKFLIEKIVDRVLFYQLSQNTPNTINNFLLLEKSHKRFKIEKKYTQKK